MTRVELRLGAHEPGRSFRLELWSGESAIGHILLEAPEIDGLIEQLMNARETLADAVPHGLDPGTRTAALVDPVWRIPKRLQDGDRALYLRHPGLGWLAFLFPEHEAEAISRQLIDPDAQASDRVLEPATNPFLSPPTSIRVEETKHAQAMISERGIDRDWVRRAILDPDEREPDPSDPALMRHYKKIPERGDRVLRLVFRPIPGGLRIVTVFLDRGRKS